MNIIRGVSADSLYVTWKALEFNKDNEATLGEPEILDADIDQHFEYRRIEPSCFETTT